MPRDLLAAMIDRIAAQKAGGDRLAISFQPSRTLLSRANRGDSAQPTPHLAAPAREVVRAERRDSGRVSGAKIASCWVSPAVDAAIARGHTPRPRVLKGPKPPLYEYSGALRSLRASITQRPVTRCSTPSRRGHRALDAGCGLRRGRPDADDGPETLAWATASPRSTSTRPENRSVGGSRRHRSTHALPWARVAALHTRPDATATSRRGHRRRKARGARR